MSHRHLFLLRHAKSSWDSDVPSDFERPLAQRGLKDAFRIAAWMGSRGIVPDHIVSSPAVRAIQTVQQICVRLALPEELVRRDEHLYLASLATLLQVLAGVPATAGFPLLVAHNPGLDELLLYLCGEGLPYTGSGKLMTTAALVRIELPDEWSRLPARCGKVIDFIRAKELEQP